MAKNKMVKKLAVAVMAVAMMVATVPMGAIAADHPAANYKDGRLCNNTYRTNTHKDLVAMQPIGAHITGDGYDCTMTYYTYKHEVCCTVCGYYFGIYQKSCTIRHSQCGTVVVDH